MEIFDPRRGILYEFDPNSLNFARAQSLGMAAPRSAPKFESPVGPNDSPRLKRLMIGNTMGCNLGCTYCYNELFEKAGYQTDIPKLKEHIRSLAEMNQGSNFFITFIGGEPLTSLKSLKELIEYSLSMRDLYSSQCELTVYTNGLLMDSRFVDWANSRSVSLVVSLDGPPAVNDLVRVTRGGRGTSKRILENIRYMIESRGQCFNRVRCVTPGGVDLAVLHEYFFGLGFNEIHLQPAYSNMGTQYPVIEQEIKVINWYLSKLKSQVILDVAPYSHQLIRLAQRGKAIQSHYPCDAGLQALGVAPDGHVFTCHHFFEDMDTSFPGAALPQWPERSLTVLTVNERNGCSTCFARHLCGGECYHRSYSAGQGMFGQVAGNCTHHRAMVPVALSMFEEILLESPKSLKHLLQGEYTRPDPQEWAYRAVSLSEVPEIQGA